VAAAGVAVAGVAAVAAGVGGAAASRRRAAAAAARLRVPRLRPHDRLVEKDQRRLLQPHRPLLHRQIRSRSTFFFSSLADEIERFFFFI